MDRRHRNSRRARITFSAAALVAAMAPAGPAAAAAPVEVVFNFTGAEQSWIVPDNISTIHVVLVGGNGGDVASSGFAHVVTGDLAVTQGATLYVEVGGKGANSSGPSGAAGGFNGGGAGGTGSINAGAGGGGASDIRTVARAEVGSLESRLIVAAGGGGGGGALGLGGEGGNAEANGTSGSQGSGPQGSGGLRGFLSHGGPGGSGSSGALDGLGGTFGAGGAGGDSTVQGGNGGGGGGGGYYGGGGGGGGADAGGGGGGGGASYVGTAQNSSITLNSSANPSITITYVPSDGPPDPTPGPDSGVVDADVTVPASAACIELSTTSISFGTQRFGGENIPASPQITVTNCSGSDEALLARGTAATGTGAAWNLVDDAGTCGAGTLATDDFHLKLNRPADEVDPVTQLSTDNKQIAELTGGATTVLEALLDMPCPGSSGAGQTMGMQIVFVVTELE